MKTRRKRCYRMRYFQMMGFSLGWLLFGAYLGQFAWWWMIGKAPNDYSVYALYVCAGLGMSFIYYFGPRSE